MRGIFPNDRGFLGDAYGKSPHFLFYLSKRYAFFTFPLKKNDRDFRIVSNLVWKLARRLSPPLRCVNSPNS